MRARARGADGASSPPVYQKLGQELRVTGGGDDVVRLRETGDAFRPLAGGGNEPTGRDAHRHGAERGERRVGVASVAFGEEEAQIEPALVTREGRLARALEEV